MPGRGLQRCFVPYGGYWSTPFCKWQGALAGQHSMKLAAATARSFFQSRGTSPEVLDGIALGVTVPQKHGFYGAPWLGGLLGAPTLTGPTIAQACATSVRVIASMAGEVELGWRRGLIGVTCDRTSNGPHIYYPDSSRPGGMGEAEDPVWDNFNLDPYAGGAMVETAENVARAAGITRAQQDEVALLRHSQYQMALADNRAFQRRYMVPVSVGGGRVGTIIDSDEGVFSTTRAGLEKLRPVVDRGTVTFGSQTHPADGNAGMIVCTKAQAREFAPAGSPTIQLLGFGEARVDKGLMPMAAVPAARSALRDSNVGLGDCAAIKTHNPFAVSDIYFCSQLGVDLEAVNRFGSPLIYGHPQAPTGMRAVIELIEELYLAGGGYGMFSGCAAGDTAMALVLKVD